MLLKFEVYSYYLEEPIVVMARTIGINDMIHTFPSPLSSSFSSS